MNLRNSNQGPVPRRYVAGAKLISGFMVVNTSYAIMPYDNFNLLQSDLMYR